MLFLFSNPFVTICAQTPLIVIDPGHGGKDPGTQGEHAVEKEIVLDIALQLRQLLTESAPWIQVELTRSDDSFIPLHERTKMANAHQADMFLSLHCNHFKNKHTQGTEVYVMGLHKSAENLDVSKRENASMRMEENMHDHYEIMDMDSDEAHILLSLQQHAYLQESISLGSSILNFLHQHTKLKIRGVKQAGFVVLRRSTMPSVLIETGFLSNQEDESYLNSEEGKQKISEALFNTIVDYFPEPIRSSTQSYQIEICEIPKTETIKMDVKWQYIDSYQVINKEFTNQYITGNFFSKFAASKHHEYLLSKGFHEAKIVSTTDE